jgi:hypothetical protein
MIIRRNRIEQLSEELAVVSLGPPRISHETAQNCIRGYVMRCQHLSALAYVQIKRLLQRQLLQLLCVAYSSNGVVRCKSKKSDDNGRKFEMDALLFKRISAIKWLSIILNLHNNLNFGVPEFDSLLLRFSIPFISLFLKYVTNILLYVDPLLGNDREIRKYTTAFIRHRSVNSNRGTVLYVRSVLRCYKQDKLG